MPSLDFEAEKTRFRTYYGDNYELLKEAEEFVRSLITSLLSQTPQLAKPTIVSRVKDREESIAKFSRKYQAQLESTKQPYEIKDCITDLIGMRVICLYEEDISKVVDTLRANFCVLEETDKIKKVETTEDTFGYKGFHMDVVMNDARKALPEYRRFCGLRYEVQVRTIIQDAWSVLDHKIKYKKAIPAKLKRRINTLAALFELADHEFLSIKDQTEQLKGEAEAQAGNKIISSAELTTPSVQSALLDVFSFLTVAQKIFPTYNFYDFAADGFVQEILKASESTGTPLNAKSLETILDDVLPVVQDYRDESPYTLNPYTQIRHALYLHDKDCYRTMLFDRQRASFDAWLQSQDTSLESPNRW